MSALADVVLRDTLVNRPAAGIAGRLFYDTTNSQLQRDNGSSWDSVEGATGAGGGEFTEQQTVTLTSGNLSTTSTTFVDATGLSITMTTAAVRCLVIFTAVGNLSTTGQVDVDLAIDGTRVGASAAHGFNFFGGNSSAFHIPLGFTYLTDVLTAASHTLKIQWRVTAGTGLLYASTTQSAARFTVIETSMAA